MMRHTTVGLRPFFAALLLLAILMLAGCGAHTGQGAHAVVVRDEHADGIWVRVLFAAGSAYDLPGKEGLAYLTAHALRRDPEPMRARREAVLSSLGVRLDLSIDRDVAIFDGYCPTSAWPEFSSLLVSIFREPSPDSIDVPRLIADQLAALEKIRSDDVALAQAALQHYLYRNHPYGHAPEGRDSTLGTLTGLDVRDFWRRHYTGGSFALGLAGAVPQDADQALQAALRAALSAAQPDTVSIPDPVVTTPNVFIIERPGCSEPILWYGAPSIALRGSPGFVALCVLATFLTEPGASQNGLDQVLRAKRGLADELESLVGHRDLSQASTPCRMGALACGPPRRRDYFALGAGAKLVNAAYVLRIIRYEMNHSREHLIGTADLETARRTAIGASRPNEQPAEQVMQARLKDLWLNTTGFTDQFTADAAQVTTVDVQSAAATVFDPARLVLVAVVPNGQEFGTMLLSGQIQYQYPSTVDQIQIRRDDEPYLSQQQSWNPNQMRIIKATDMFR